MSILENEARKITFAFTPTTLPLPELPKKYDIPTFPRRSKKNDTTEILNPITDRYVDNTYPNRKRILASINKANEKYKEVVQQRNEIFRINLASHVSGISSQSIFSNFARVNVLTTGITDLETFYNTIKKTVNRANDILGSGSHEFAGVSPWVVSSVILYWVQNNNKVAIRTTDASIFSARLPYTYQDFVEEVRRLEAGTEGVAGSDAILVNDEIRLDYSAFGVYLRKLPRVGDKAMNNVFEVEGVEGNGKCFLLCLEKLNLLPDSNNIRINDLETAIKFITDNKINIDIISNVFDSISIDLIRTNEIVSRRLKSEKINKNNKKLFLYKVEMKDIKINKLYQHDKYRISPNQLLYCPVDKHIDILKTPLTLCDGIYCSETGDIYKEIDGETVKHIYSINNIYKNTTKSKDIMEEWYIFFDYEAVVDWSDGNIMCPYSLSWFGLKHEELLDIVKQEVDDKNEAMISVLERSKEQRCFNTTGFNSSEKFIKWILDNESHKIFRFVSYNGANFDNIILLRDLLEYRNNLDNKDAINIDNRQIQYNGNQLLNFKFNGRHTFYDMRRHLIGSLASNCVSFKVPKKYAKLELDHNEIQHKYNKYIRDAKPEEGLNDHEIQVKKRLLGREAFINDMKQQEELVEYNNNDVISLCFLFCKYYRAMTNIKGLEFLKDGFSSYTTIGKIIATKFKKHCEKNKIDLPLLTIDQYNDMQKYKIAGRCEMFNGKQRINDPICSLDICSMYPYVMTVLDCYYPCGEIKQATKYYNPKDKLGFWYCDIDQRALKAHNLPNIYAEKTGVENKWDSEEILKGYLVSNITIDLLLKYKHLGVKVKIYNKYECETENGEKELRHSFYFTEKKRSIDMFEFLAEFMKAKNEQDTLKKNNDETYNPALRETLKLGQNSLSGKVIQGLFLDKITVVDNIGKYDEIVAKHKDVNVINTVGDKVFLSYKTDIEDNISRQSPIYLGCFIYEYARTYMYNVLLSRVGLNKCLYQDTDCLKFREKDMKEWIEKYGSEPVPHWPDIGKYDDRYNQNHPLYSADSKVFGSFENELKDNNLFILLQKKVWLVAKLNENNEPTYIKCRYKGVNPSSLLLNLTEPFLECNTKDNEETYNIKKDKKTGEQLISDELIFEWAYEADKTKQIGSDYDKKEGKIQSQIQFFNTVYDKGCAYVLCNNLRRVIKNTSRNVSVEDDDRYNYYNNTIQLVYMVKKIKL